MMHECIPIGSAVGGMPDIIGESGYRLEQINNDELVVAIREILQRPAAERTFKSKLARRRILEEYPLSKREKNFLSLLTEP